MGTLQSFAAQAPATDPEARAAHYRRQLEALANNATLALFILDERQHCTFMNRAAEQLTGYALDEVQGKPLHHYVHHTRPDGTPYPLEECPIDRAFPENLREQGEELFVHKDGHFYPVAFTASPIREGNRTVGTIVEIQDISARKREEAEAAERTRLAAFQWNVGIALTQSASLRDALQRCAEAMVEHLDAAFARVWTLNEAEQVLELQASAGLYTHLDGPHGRVPVGQYKIGLIAQERKPHLTNQVVGDPRVGDQAWAKREGMVAFAGYPLLIGDRLVGVMALFSRQALSRATLDAMASVANALSLAIQRSSAEQERATLLKRVEFERARLAALFEQAPAIVAVLSGPRHVFTLANPRYRQLIGNREVLGKPVREALPEIESQGFFELLDNVYTRGEPFIGTELPVELDRSGTGTLETGYINFVYQPMRDERDQVWGIFVHAVDVTDLVLARQQVEASAREITGLNARLQRRAEELAAANRELEAFSYSVSHDLRAPLRAIDGFSRILLEEHAADLPPEAQRYLQLVRHNANQMGQLIDDLLAFSRLNRQALARAPLDPAALVRQVIEDLRQLQEGRNVQVKIADLPRADADPTLLRQVYANLLSNALKFTRRRDPAIIEVGALQQDGETVYFVRDNGVGFDSRYADKLFGVFQRLHRAEDYEGTGVGTAIVQRIVHRHGGRVWAEAEVDRGATFYFTLGSTSDQ